MPRGNPALDPFCQQCGLYKGIGLCKNPSCTDDRLSDDYDIDELSESSDTSKSTETESCSMCERQEIVSCSRCGRAFCEIHSSNSKKTRVQSPKHYIGTCDVCAFFVCENCWVVNDNGNLICLNHLENGTWKLGSKQT